MHIHLRSRGFRLACFSFLRAQLRLENVGDAEMDVAFESFQCGYLG